MLAHGYGACEPNAREHDGPRNAQAKLLALLRHYVARACAGSLRAAVPATSLRAILSDRDASGRSSGRTCPYGRGGFGGGGGPGGGGIGGGGNMTSCMIAPLEDRIIAETARQDNRGKYLTLTECSMPWHGGRHPKKGMRSVKYLASARVTPTCGDGVALLPLQLVLLREISCCCSRRRRSKDGRERSGTMCLSCGARARFAPGTDHGTDQGFLLSDSDALEGAHAVPTVPFSAEVHR